MSGPLHARTRILPRLDRRERVCILALTGLLMPLIVLLRYPETSGRSLDEISPEIRAAEPRRPIARAARPEGSR